jgi:competence protein ComEC
MGSVLFTGDIEKKVEQQLLKKYAKQLQVDILIVPHHGSNTSSNQAFVDAINPKISIVSVGYKNRYKLPANRVMARYEAIDSELIQTDSSGAITVQLLSDDVISIERYREKSRKYWHHKLN